MAHFLTLKNIRTMVSSASTEEAVHIKILEAYRTHTSTELVGNVRTAFKFAMLDKTIIPITINNEFNGACYVCSIYTAYISYALEALSKIHNYFIRGFLRGVINLVGFIFKNINVDQVVANNNFLLSTNLYAHSFSAGALQKYTASLVSAFPDHAILFRSLNTYTNQEHLTNFLKNGYILLPSRQVYIFDTKLTDYTKTNNYKADLKLLYKNDYQHVSNEGIQETDYERIVELYHKLYIQKYSEYNPQFTMEYIRLCHKTRFLKFFGLRNRQGVLDGVIACYDRDGVTTTPIGGYDTNLPPEVGLYRRLMAYCMERAHTENLVLNLGSGASTFKILRGGKAFNEYSVLYIHHLSSLRRRLGWRFLALVLNKIVVQIVKILKL